jgi:hypothetical protein
MARLLILQLAARPPISAVRRAVVIDAANHCAHVLLVFILSIGT